MRPDLPIAGSQRASGLVDILDRVLDKGLAIAGDIKISLAEVELLTIRIRLIICSIDKAQEIGLDWWKYDPNLTHGPRQRLNQSGLIDQVRRLERKVAALSAKTPAARRRALKQPERRTGDAS
ncbi:MAG TPA: gas vesicle protein [Acidimicrobiia bacterium]